MKYFLTTLLGFGSLASCVLAGLGSPGFTNLIYVIAGFSAFIGLVILVVGTKEIPSDPTRPTWHKTLFSVIDLSEILVLAWFGFFWCAAAFIIGALASAAIRYK